MERELISLRELFGIKEEDANDNNDNDNDNSRMSNNTYNKISSTSNVVRPMVGVISDCGGSGKSLTILGMLLFMKPLAPVVVPPLSTGIDCISFACDNISIVIDSPRMPNVPTSVIVIPHTLVSQWTSYANSFRHHLSSTVVSRYKHVCNLACDISRIRSLDLIIVSNTFYDSLALTLNRMHVKLARVFIDEADTISISSSLTMSAGFHWYVTSNAMSLMQGSRANAHIVNNTFSSEGMSSHHHHRRLHEPTRLIVRNEDAFVLRSFTFAVPSIANVTCQFVSIPPWYSSPIRPSLGMRVLAAMESGKDIDTALRLIPSSQHESDELGALKRLLTSSIPGVVRRAEARTSIVTSSTPEEIASCSICYENIGSYCIQPQVVVPCCANSFCLRCLCRWLAVSPGSTNIRSSATCPICRSPTRLEDAIVVHPSSSDLLLDHPLPPAPKVAEDDTEVPISGNDVFCKTETLKHLLRTILLTTTSPPSSHGRRVIIFSSHWYAFESISQCLGELSLPFAFLRGNSGGLRNTINRFRAGDERVILEIATHHAAGMNMDMVSDIIFMHPPHQELFTRLIECAIRVVGRTSQLRVWNMFYEGDISDPYTQYPSITPGEVANRISAAS
eukprot:gene17284-biopygen26201